MDNTKNNKRANTMEITKVSAALLVTVILAFGAFMLQTGTFRNELKNVKENQIVIKKDLKEDINRKAEKDIVNLIFEEIKSIKEILSTKD